MVVKERPEEKGLQPLDRWILSRFSKVVRNASQYYDDYQFDKVMREVEEFAWHEYADHYLELVKYRTREGDDGVRFTLYTITLGIAKLLAPLLPHVTEDIYQDGFAEMDDSKSIHISAWPQEVLSSDEDEVRGNMVKDVVSAIRSWKAERKLALNKEMELIELIGPSALSLKGYEKDILETSRAKELKIVAEAYLEEKVVAVKPVKSRIGPTFKAQGKEVLQLLESIDPQEAADELEMGSLKLTLADGTTLDLDASYIEVQKKLTLGGKAVETLQVRDVLIAVSP
jgi:valyl-tRNA synthetase